MANPADTGFDDPARTTASIRRRDRSGRIGGQPMCYAGPRPSFLYIGAPRSGSTWIHQALRDHPDVFVPVAKEIKFFDYNYDRGWDWYLDHFRNAGAAQAVGEVCHDYYVSEEAAHRIRAALPEVRLICCLREPGDFAVSVVRWLQSHTRRFGSTFAEIAEHPDFARVLAYRKNLEIFFDLFPRDHILVVFYERLRADPRNFIRELYEFVGVDPDYEPELLAERRNAARAPRSRVLLSTAFEAAQLLRRLGVTNLIGTVKRNAFVEKLLYRSVAGVKDRSAQLELDRIAERVRHQAAGELDALARLIGKPLPAQWRRAAQGPQ